MKRRELVKLLEDNGWYMKRNGGNHDIYTDGNRTEVFPFIYKGSSSLMRDFQA